MWARALIAAAASWRSSANAMSSIRHRSSRVRGAIAATRQPVDVVLLELGLLHESRLADHEAAFLGLDRVRSEEFPDEFGPENELPAEFLRRMELVPLRTTADRVVVATARPLRHDAVRALQYYLRRPVEVKVATQSEVQGFLKRSAEPAD